MTTQVTIKSDGPKPVTISLIQKKETIHERTLFPGDSNVFSVWSNQIISIRENENPTSEACP